MSPSSFVFSSENPVTTILGVVQKQLVSSKSKKKTKHMFCIVNDVHTCCQTKQQHSIDEDDDVTVQEDAAADVEDLESSDFSTPKSTTKNNFEGLADPALDNQEQIIYICVANRK